MRTYYECQICGFIQKNDGENCEYCENACVATVTEYEEPLIWPDGTTACARVKVYYSETGVAVEIEPYGAKLLNR